MATSSAGAETTGPSPIAVSAQACRERFERLLSNFSEPQRKPINCITQAQVLDHFGQFRIWAGNIGAFQPKHMASSLDHRLREAPKFSREVVSLLEDLAEALDDGDCGDRAGGWGSFQDSEQLEEDYDETPTADGAELDTNEAEELMQYICDLTSRLFRVSVMIQSSSSKDKHTRALATTSTGIVDPSYDIDHVRNKFPCLGQEDRQWLGIRLGKAITRRRQFLWYRRDHREKLAKAPTSALPMTERHETQDAKFDQTTLGPDTLGGGMAERVADTMSRVTRPLSTLAPTSASTLLPSKLEGLSIDQGFTDEEDRTSVSSYASSFGDDDEENCLSVIKFKDVAKPRVPFECPYCWTIQKFNDHRSWRKHVFTDLQPYVCTAESCDMKLFGDVNTWFTHELQNHLVEWRCGFCDEPPFASLASFQLHIKRIHSTEIAGRQLEALTATCQTPLQRLVPIACRICDTWEGKLRALNEHIPLDETLVVTPQQFRHHVGGHMEQMALFAIPRGYQEPEDGDSGIAAQGVGSESRSSRSRSIAAGTFSSYKETGLKLAYEVNARLLQAAIATNQERFDVVVITNFDFQQHGGTDLANPTKPEDFYMLTPGHYTVSAPSTFQEFVDAVAAELDVDPRNIRLWVVIKRQNKTFRPEFPIENTSKDFLDATRGYGMAKNIPPCTQQFWVEKAGEIDVEGNPVWQDWSQDFILLFLKYFDPDTMSLRGICHLYFNKLRPMGELVPLIIDKMGWPRRLPDGTCIRLLLWEEIHPNMIERKPEKRTAQQHELQNGDIICFKRVGSENEATGSQPRDQVLRKSPRPQARDYYKSLLDQENSKNRIEAYPDELYNGPSPKALRRTKRL